MAELVAHGMENWIPYKLEQREGQWCCRWLSVAGKVFSEPFFSETIQHCKKFPANSQHYASLSSVDYLSALAATITDAVKPSAFIFHTSRCGSTLISQLLGASERHIVLSEVPLLDELLRLSLNPDRAAGLNIKQTLKSSISLLGRQRCGQENHVFIKLDSWHVYFAPLIRALYPDVPFVLLYRAPEEVVRSHQKRRGMMAIPGLLEPQLFGLSLAVLGEDADNYLGRVLTYYFARFASMASQEDYGRTMLLDYRQGALEIFDRLAALCALTVSEEEREKVESRSRFHSKYPDQPFSEEATGIIATESIIAAQRMYQRLEQIRMQ